MSERPQAARGQRYLLPISIVLFAGSLGLILAGYRTIAGWLVLVSCFATLMTAILLRRSQDRAG
jgi:hypothetical protein